MNDLLSPARYAPWLKGVYDVSPSFRPFGFDFGNGDADRCVFQIDSERDRYLENKHLALQERLDKYVLRHEFTRELEQAFVDLFVARLAAEYPGIFQVNGLGADSHFESPWGNFALEVGSSESPLDQIAKLIQEDFAIVSVNALGDSVSYLNICAPSHWSPEEKIGRPFFKVHEPVADFDRVNLAAPKLLAAMVNGGPFVRFGWTVVADNRLNHHPEPPLGYDEFAWNHRNFTTGEFWMRTERQVVWGIPEVGATLFIIRVILTPGAEILANDLERQALLSSLESMSPATRAYKGLAPYWSELMGVLTR